jgi:hypothetical protein
LRDPVAQVIHGNRRVAVVTAYRTALLTVVATLTVGCAITRSNVKSLRDRDVNRIRFDNVIDTTVSALNALPSHCGPSRDHRIRDEESAVYRVVGRIVRVKREHDHDIHIVLEDPDDPRERIIVESDDPDYHANVSSPFREEIAAARRSVEELVGAPGSQQFSNAHNLTVRVTGVGFFDMNHFQVGKSRSCIELHPIIAMERAGTIPVPKIDIRLLVGWRRVASSK